MKINDTLSKITILMLLLVLGAGTGYSQIRVGPPSGSLDNSSSLEVESGPYPSGSPYRGLLAPAVTTTQRGQIQNPAKGLIVFNTTTNQIEVNTGTSTTPVWTPGGAVGTGGGNNSWSLTGNSGTTSNNFLGTTDLTPLNFRVNNLRAGLIDPTPNRYNVAFGFPTLGSGATGQANTAIGAFALGNQNSDASFNTAIGYRSMVTNTTGSVNVALGGYSLEGNVSGHDNTALGHSSLRVNTSGQYNTAVGTGSLANNTSGYENTALGANSSGQNTTGYSNLALGTDALASNLTGYDNVAVGASALFRSKGFANTSVGALSLYYNVAGIYNTAVGDLAGQYNTSGMFNTYFGVNAGPAVKDSTLINSMALGYNSIVSATNTIVLGNNFISSLRCNVQTISSLSDKRIKEDIEANVPGLNFITKLTPVTYHVNKIKEAKLVGYSLPSPSSSIQIDSTLHSGFLAQDVEAAAKEVGYNFEGVRQEEGGKYYTLGYTLFVVPLVQAVKDLNTEVEKLKVKVQENESAYQELLSQIKEMQKVYTESREGVGRLSSDKSAKVSR